MNNLSSKWQKLILWLTGLLGITPFIIGGGYVFLKTEDEDVRTSAKMVLFLLAGFTGLSMLFSSILYPIFTLFELYTAASVISDITSVIGIIKTLVFAVLFILDLVGIKLLPTVANDKKAD